MLMALQPPTEGRAALLGLDAAADSAAVHRRVGYLPGDLKLFPRLTGRQHIAWFARARSVDIGSLARQLADRFQVVVDRPVRELSKGNRQKIGLVLAFMHRPELPILDEPTSGLDPLMQPEFENLLRETIAEGRTVFLSSHELDEVQRIADRIAIIREGRLVARTPWTGCAGRTPEDGRALPPPRRPGKAERGEGRHRHRVRWPASDSRRDRGDCAGADSHRQP